MEVITQVIIISISVIVKAIIISQKILAATKHFGIDFVEHF